MSDSYFLDTNVLIYSFDGAEPAKQARARELVAEGLRGPGAISFQVVQEFLNVALRKFAQPMTSEQAREYLDAVLLPMCRLHSEPDLYRDALALRVRHQFSWYDALIVGAALRCRCVRLYSEDLQHGQKVGSLTILNPFR
jgi:predicted nucleic acid-binding protein